MKKILVSAALLATCALYNTAAYAQPTVTISGLIDAGYHSHNFKGQKVDGVAHNGSSTSTIQLAGSEDLGGGLRASFKLNSDFDITRSQSNTGSTVPTAGSWLNGEQRVGLSGRLGAVDVGVINNLALTAGGTGSNFGTGIGSGFRALYNTDVLAANGTAGNNGASVVRFDNTLRYTSPVFNGVRLHVSRVGKNTNSSATNFNTTQFNYDFAGVQETAVTYSKGPLNVAFANQKQQGKDLSQSTANARALVDSTLNTLGANYTMGAVRVFGLYQTSKVDDATFGVDRRLTQAGADYAMGAVTLKAAYGVLKNNKITSGDNTSELLGLGADYAMSKRTALYARYERINDGANAVANPSTLAAVAGETSRIRTAVGIRHTF